MKNTNTKELCTTLEYGLIANSLDNRTKFYLLLDNLLKLEEACYELYEKEKKEEEQYKNEQ